MMGVHTMHVIRFYIFPHVNENRAASDGKLGGAWERGYRLIESDLLCLGCLESILII